MKTPMQELVDELEPLANDDNAVSRTVSNIIKLAKILKKKERLHLHTAYLIGKNDGINSPEKSSHDYYSETYGDND